jgi:hypothetical protein
MNLTDIGILILKLGGVIPYFLINYMNPSVSLEEAHHIYDIVKKGSLNNVKL